MLFIFFSQISVSFNGMVIPKSPFSVNVQNVTVNAGKCSATGPGIQPTGVFLNEPTYFEIHTAGA